MIAASDPLEFIPCGRQHLSRHPGEVVLPSTQPQLQPESFLLHRLSQVVLGDDHEHEESWTIRETATAEEELYVNGKTAVWSRGTFNSRLVLCAYTCETPIKSALWCTFYVNTSDKAAFELSPATTVISEEPKGAAMPSVCIVDAENIKVFTAAGEDYIASLQFQVKNVWSTKYGLLLERITPPKDRFLSHLPTIFSLLHPLDEMAPVLAHRGVIEYMANSALTVVFTSENPSIAVIYDSKTGLHSVWKIRKARIAELHQMCDPCPSNDVSSSMPSTITTASAMNLQGLSGSSGNASSAATSSRTGLTHSLHSRLMNSPLHNSTSQSPKPSFSVSHLHSPTFSSSTVCRGVHSPASRWRSSPLSSKAFSPSVAGTPPPESRMMTSQMVDHQVETKPLFPELCLQHIWSENLGVSREGVLGGPATRVFLSSDLVGQQYLYYMVPSRNSLFSTRLDKTNTEQQLIFGVVTSIVAKDAAYLPQLNMIATVDLSGAVVLYSGLTVVGKVHVGGVSTAMTTSSYLSLNMGSSFGTPFTRRNSILSSSRPASAMEPARFDEDVHLLSPVASNETIGSRNLMMDCSALEDPARYVSTPRVGKLEGLRDPVSNRLTLKYTDGSLYRVSLPDLCSSPLVEKCMNTLKQVLPREKAMQLIVKWYSVRNAPGTQDISPLEEWQMFISVLLELMGYEVDKLWLNAGDSGSNSPTQCGNAAKKKRVSDSGTESDWLYLLNSSHHKTLDSSLSNLFGFRTISLAKKQPSVVQEAAQINCKALLFRHIYVVLYSLHLLYEDLKCDMLLTEYIPLLAKLLHQLSTDLKQSEYSDHYWKDYPSHVSHGTALTSQIPSKFLAKMPRPLWMPPEPPDIFSTVNAKLTRQGSARQAYPHIGQVNQTSRDVVLLVSLICQGVALPLENVIVNVAMPGVRNEPQLTVAACNLRTDSMPERVVWLMTEIGLTRAALTQLPPGIAMLFNTVLYSCRKNPSLGWSEAAYKLIVREDLVAQCRQLEQQACVGEDRANLLNTALPTSPSAGGNGENRKTSATPRVAECDQDDGMEAMDMELLKLRFSTDHRIAEVRRLLQSSAPVPISITQRPEVSDHEFIEEQEKHLYAICTRTMALPLGRGMFTLRTAAPVVTETLPIPRLCLTGKVPPRDTTVDLTHIEVVPNMNLWPLFHNGVAAGLRIAPNATDIDSTWIVFNKPKGASEVPTEHAGFLMALGLNGHLKNLAVLKTFEYLIKCHEMTSVGLLLGVAACKRGTMDVASTKLMSIHIEALLPPTSIEMDMPQNIQVAALLGIGLVYEGTAHRHMAEVLLTEIGRPPGPEMENSVDRESYSLAAGLALGLVVLGNGSKPCGLGDLAISDTLHYYMVGGHRRPLTGSQKEKYKSPSYQIREGDSVNIDVTSPGATLALGMMYFNTGNRAVADWMKAPGTQYLLDFVRPDFLLLRIVARSLILWDTIVPSKEWVESNVPLTIRPYCLVKPSAGMPENVDYETMNQAYCNILGGACMAIGLRYAGSANQSAFKTLLDYSKMFTSLLGKSIAELAGKSTIETCLNVIVLALAMVMSGTGELEVMRLCRFLRSRVGPTISVVTYGSHVAVHMALGLLFLGGGRFTLGTSPSAIAAMICAFFPKFPTHSNDNRYHLQAFRHLYVLAAEPRLVIPRDIDTGCLCYVHLTVVHLSSWDHQQKEIRLKAPCILPELSKLERVVVEDGRYWSIVFQKDRNWSQLQTLLNNSGCLDVKQRAGCLSYLEDPHGFRSLLAKTLSCDTAISWSVSADSICSFSSDPAVVNFVRHFLDVGQVSEQSVSELQLIKALTLLAYECVTQDKLAILPVWINLITALQSLSNSPSLFLMWQLKLIFSQALYWREPPRDLVPLVSCESALSLEEKVRRILDSWEKDNLKPLVRSYMNSTDLHNVYKSKRLSTFLTFYDIPSRLRLAEISSRLTDEDNPHSIRDKLSEFQLPGHTLNKLAQILQYN